MYLDLKLKEILKECIKCTLSTVNVVSFTFYSRVTEDSSLLRCNAASQVKWFPVCSLILKGQVVSEGYYNLASNAASLPMILQAGAKQTHVFESACDFFLWGYLKSKVYMQKPHTVDDLKVSIREEIATVPQEMLVNVMQNFEERLQTCVWQEGCHLSNIIFHN